jgi:hypothetical protein
LSNLGQGALIVVGTVIGAIYGGPAGAQLGFALGSTATVDIPADDLRQFSVSIPLERVYRATVGSMLRRRERND